MSTNIKYPIGVQDFESLINDGYIYVDKTQHLYNLVNSGRYFFLSRPRRFGKSLFLSTLKAYFEGKKELFKGLAIEHLEKNWDTYPILYLDLNSKKFETTNDLEDLLSEQLDIWEKDYGVSEYNAIELRFKRIISQVHKKTGKRVVVLVDEYDKPLLQAIGNKPLLNDYRDTLKAFYGVLKTMDSCIKFAMLTGVTKFGKVSVFSDLNNLTDMSMDSRYFDICGISENELHKYFNTSIEQLAHNNNQTFGEACEKLKEEYDGYHFNEKTKGIYNPFSLLNTLEKQTYNSYWFETGTPTFLVELLKQSDYNLNKISGIEIDKDAIDSIFTSNNPIPVIYQSGYLTICGYDSEFKLYKLDFPNREVKEGFIKFLMPYYTSFDKVQSPFEIREFAKDLRAGNINDFMTRLQSFFANVNYDQIVKDVENWYQNVIYIVTTLAGYYVEAERRTANGRIDLVIKTSNYIYVMEFKLQGTAEEAMQQINSKNYPLPYTKDSRKLYKIGVNFDSTLRNIEKWIVEES